MRKSFIMFLLTSLTVTSLIACSSDSSNTTLSNSNNNSSTISNANTNSNTSNSTSTDLAVSAGNWTDEYGSPMGLNFPLDEPQQLTFHYHARNMYAFDEDWPVFQEMAEITNVFLKNTANPVGTNSVEQLQLHAVDGFPSDIYGGDNIASYFMQYGPEGCIVCLYFVVYLFSCSQRMWNVESLLVVSCFA